LAVALAVEVGRMMLAAAAVAAVTWLEQQLSLRVWVSLLRLAVVALVVLVLAVLLAGALSAI